MPSGKQKHILVAVLDWGLGHATRSIPVINCLLSNHCNVSIAGNGPSLQLLKQEFPQLAFHELPSYRITYPLHRNFFLHLLLQMPTIFRAIRNEHMEVEKLIVKNHFDAIISDNRYGCYSAKVPSIFLTHQLNIQLPSFLIWSKKWVNSLNQTLIKKFTECWVPDFSDSQLTGKLTETKILNVKFIGMLSRFEYQGDVIHDEYIVGIVSGPEPQREVFEKLLIEEFQKLKRPCLLVRGVPHQERQEIRNGDITLINHAAANELQEIIARAGYVISRSGYSTIMDLQALGKKQVIFVPTPGQTEQEYLSYEMERKKIAITQAQDKLNMKAAIERVKAYKGFDASKHPANLLNEAIQLLLQQI